jgi:hypothetical protein
MSKQPTETRAKPALRRKWHNVTWPGPLWSALAAVLLLLLTIGAGLEVRHYKERRLIARLERLGAQCRTTVVAPNWLRELVGDRWLTPFERTNAVLFNFYTPPDFNLADEDLSCLADLPNLEHLSLNRTRVTDESLVPWERLPSLKILRLVDTDVSDDCVEHLLKLTTLEELDLYRTQVTAAGATRLEKLPNLRFFRGPDTGFPRYLPPSSK